MSFRSLPFRTTTKWLGSSGHDHQIEWFDHPRMAIGADMTGGGNVIPPLLFV